MVEKSITDEYNNTRPGYWAGDDDGIGRLIEDVQVKPEQSIDLSSSSALYYECVVTIPTITITAYQEHSKDHTLY